MHEIIIFVDDHKLTLTTDYKIHNIPLKSNSRILYAGNISQRSPLADYFDSQNKSVQQH